MLTICRLSLLLLVLGLGPAVAQQTTALRKPPVGVPVDAKFSGGHWYRVYFEKLSWPAARQKCTGLGGQLPIVPDEATWTFVKDLTQGTSLWLGATDEQTEGVWKWIDGTPVTLKVWYEGQPDNLGGRENYLSTHRNQWNDAPKDGQYVPKQFVVGYICEWKDK